MTHSNVQVLLRDRNGQVVPGSVRHGHNVMTVAGRELLTQLTAWNSIGVADASYTQRRPRYISAGSGSQPEHHSVTRMVSPVTYVVATYLKALDHTLTEFPTFTSVKLKTVFGPAEITHSVGSVTVSEVGLFFDVSPGGVLSVGSPDNVPAFYKAFDPLTKLDSFSMEVMWELRF